jgi:hypothetical protein
VLELGDLMPTRRELLKTGAAMTVISAPIAKSWASIAQPTLPIFRAVFDQRYSASAAFGDESHRLGLTAYASRGEVHALWENELYPRWREQPSAIAGMTTYAALFSLDMMARDAGMQTVYRVNHRVTGTVVSHEVFGPHAVLQEHAPFSVAESHWSREAARRVSAWPDGLVPRSRSRSSIAGAGRRSVGPETLITWLIAPVRGSASSADSPSKDLADD